MVEVTATPSVKVRDQVFCSYYDPTNSIVKTIGTVLAVNTLDTAGIAESGEPSLTILVVSPAGDDKALFGPKWAGEFNRLTGVRHFHHDSHDDCSNQAAWQELPEDATDQFPDLLDERTPTPENPTFTRADDAKVLDVSRGQAAAVQSGKAPVPTLVTPLLNTPTAIDTVQHNAETAAGRVDAAKAELEAAQKAVEEAEASQKAADEQAALVAEQEAQKSGRAAVEEPVAAETPKDGENAAEQPTGNAEQASVEVNAEHPQE